MSAVVRFWMVVNVRDESGHQIDAGKHLHGFRRPGFIHETREKAEEECLRLRRNYDGIFVVLEAVSYADDGVQTTCGKVHRIQEIIP